MFYSGRMSQGKELNALWSRFLNHPGLSCLLGVQDGAVVTTHDRGDYKSGVYPTPTFCLLRC